MGRYLVIILSLLYTWCIQGQQIQIELDTNQMQIGDKVNLKIVVKTSPGQTFKAVDLSYLDSIYNENKLAEKEGPAIFEILDTSNWLINGNARQRDVSFTIWEEGNYKFAPIPLNFSSNGTERQIFSRSASILVGSPLQNTSAQDSVPLSPIKSIIETPRNLFTDVLLPILKIVGLFLAVFGIGYLIYRLLNEKKEKIREPYYITPHDIALTRLQKIQEEQPWVKEDFKGYHSDLTFALREYLENRFSINALEMTTGDIMRSLGSGKLDKQWVGQLKDIFNIADMVKFAKAVPPYDLHKSTLDKCIEFVHTTKDNTTLIELSLEEEKQYTVDLLKRKPKEDDE